MQSLPTLSITSLSADTKDVQFPHGVLYGGEEAKECYHCALWNPMRQKQIDGSAYLSTYRFFFLPTNAIEMIETEKDYCSVALGNIEKIRKAKTRRVGSEDFFGLDLHCKDFRVLRIIFSTDLKWRDAYTKLQEMAFPGNDPRHSFAFSFRPNQGWRRQGWALYNPLTEYVRMGLPTNTWRISHVNQDYRICSTYPQLFVVPSAITDPELEAVANFRSRGRLPALCWKHPRHNAAILRCSQPRVGMMGRRCKEDEGLFDSILKCNSQSNTLYVLDSRPRVNALGNQLKGAGVENMSNYPNTVLTFMNIENIHVVRESYVKLRQACLSYGATCKASSQQVASDAPLRDVTPTPHWYSLVHGTCWLLHIKSILMAVMRFIQLVREGNSVVIHCSDGWDRTSQQSGLAMICLDPFYRTLEGFLILIEKEWCSFGHKFSERLGHGDSNAENEQRAPIFVQFIDCVWQIMQQYPYAFEFNQLLLMHILDHSYSCRFGTFLCNSDRERSAFLLKEKTSSLWSFLLQNKERLYLNRNYRGGAFAESIHDTNMSLAPNAHSIAVSLWTSYYMRWTAHAPLLTTPGPSEFMNPRAIDSILAQSSNPTASAKQAESNEASIADLHIRIRLLETCLNRIGIATPADPHQLAHLATTIQAPNQVSLLLLLLLSLLSLLFVPCHDRINRARLMRKIYAKVHFHIDFFGKYQSIRENDSFY
eukprot:TRINITY_DN503_c0_g2_i1.p1 TRINITY_DN503_c0_g2~~TRINITY_DN503_c0_g2_i1.p1  ORF type:complete len:707 (+),score=91.23 TRINITY_DN503_c0_g2_i1:49-2169(+)